MTRLFVKLGILALLLAGVIESSLGQEEVYEDEEVKAAFLYHFATFVLWPEESRAEESFTIAVLGDDEVAAELEAYLPGRSIQGRPMRVRRIDSLDELNGEAVLFIGASQNPRLAQLLAEVRDNARLVVTDSPGALNLGSVINFRLVDRRVRFEVSLTAAERSGLELSSRLLSAAMFVDTTSALQQPGGRVLAGDGRIFY